MTQPAHPDAGDDNNRPTTDDASLERLRRFGGGKLLGEMIALFLLAAPERINAARLGLSAHDVKATEMALHALKSSSAQLGAMKMQRLSEAGGFVNSSPQGPQAFCLGERWLGASLNPIEHCSRVLDRLVYAHEIECGSCVVNQQKCNICSAPHCLGGDNLYSSPVLCDV